MIGFRNKLLFIKSTSADMLIESAQTLDLSTISGDLNINSFSNLVITAASVENNIVDDTMSFKVNAANIEIGRDIATTVDIKGNVCFVGSVEINGTDFDSNNITLNDSIDLKVDTTKFDSNNITLNNSIDLKANLVDLPSFIAREDNNSIMVMPGSTQTVHNLGIELNVYRAHIAAFNAQYSTMPEAVTARAKVDLQQLYNYLVNLPTAQTLTTPINNITLTAKVYQVVGAGVAEKITLSGSATDLFIFRFSGAFTTNESTQITLTGGVLASNIFWLTTAGAAIALAHIGVNNSFPGRLIAAAAASMGAGGVIDGGLYSMAGAISFTDARIRVPNESSQLNYLLKSMNPFAVFSIAGAVANTAATTIIEGDIGTHAGAITGFPATATNNMYVSTDMLSQYNIYFSSNGIIFSKRYICNLVGCIQGGIISLHSIIPASHTDVSVVVQSIRGEITFSQRAFSLIGLSSVGNL
jgi:hypothetical protein